MTDRPRWSLWAFHVGRLGGLYCHQHLQSGDHDRALSIALTVVKQGHALQSQASSVGVYAMGSDVVRLGLLWIRRI